MRVFSGRISHAARLCRLTDESGAIHAEMRAFISPLRYKNKMYLYGVNTDIGYNPEGYYLYIGPPKADLESIADPVIECGPDRYKTDRTEKVYYAEKVIYIWAVIRKITQEESQ